MMTSELLLFTIPFIFILGLAFGSFINMLVYRLHHEESVLGRSHSDYSERSLIWKDLIPVVSYVWYKGRDRETGKKLPLSYPIVELLTGVLFIIIFVQIYTLNDNLGSFLLNLLISLLYSLFLLFFAVYDYHYWEVDVYVVLVAIAFGIAVNILAIFYPLNLIINPLGGLVAACIAGLFIWFLVKITGGAGMGMGDVFLFAFIGLFVGIEGIYWAFMITVITGALVGILLMILKRQAKGLLVQFAPFICLGGFVMYLFKLEILEVIQQWLYL